MVAHSLPRPVFGPAQALHGATYVVEATFCREELDDDGIVLDIGAAQKALQETLDTLRYHNLDEHPSFTGMVTSTEVLTRWVFERLAESPIAASLDRLEVVLRESPQAWVSYRRDL
jgi:6-pyruvoyltetrahydropterin/6-carboxytetrahydropterin synthase